MTTVMLSVYTSRNDDTRQFALLRTVPADYTVNFDRNIVFGLDGLTGNGSELDLNI